MARLLDYIAAVLGLWVTSSAAWLGAGPSAVRIVVAAAGAVVTLAAAAALVRPPLGKVARLLGALAGLTALVAALPVFGASVALGWVTGVVAVLALVAQCGALKLGKPATGFALLAADGSVLMEVTALEFRGTALAMKGKMMGAMPTVAYLRPAQVGQAMRLIPLGVLVRLPVFLWRALTSKP